VPSRTKRMLGQRATCPIKRQSLRLVPTPTGQIEGTVWGAVQRGWQSSWWPSGSSAEHDDIRTTRKGTTARPCSLRRPAADSAPPSSTAWRPYAFFLPLTAIDREALECAPVRSVSDGWTMVRTRNHLDAESMQSQNWGTEMSCGSAVQRLIV